MIVFIDTGSWVAIADRNDQYSKEASQLYTDLILKREQLITSDFVLVETFNLLTQTIGNKATISVAATFRLRGFKKLLNYPFCDLKRRLKPAATRVL